MIDLFLLPGSSVTGIKLRKKEKSVIIMDKNQGDSKMLKKRANRSDSGLQKLR